MEHLNSSLDFDFKDLLCSKEFWEENFKTTFFEAIEEYLEENNLTRTDFAKQIGVSRGYISQIMNGDSDHRLSKMIDLAIAMKKAPYLYLKDLEEVIDKADSGKSVDINFKEIEEKAEKCEFLENRTRSVHSRHAGYFYGSLRRTAHINTNLNGAFVHLKVECIENEQPIKYFELNRSLNTLDSSYKLVHEV